MNSRRLVMQAATFALLAMLLSGCGGGEGDEDSDSTLAPTREQSSPISIASMPDISTVESTSAAPAEACPEETNDQGFQNGEQFQGSLTCIATLFSWPATRTPSTANILAGFTDPQNASFEQGLAYSVLATQHTCAWYGEWLDGTAANDATRTDAALTVMTEVIPAYPTSILGFPSDVLPPEAGQDAQQRAERAALGDPAPIQEYYNVQCSAIQWAPAA